MIKICDPDLIDVQILLESHPKTLLHVGKTVSIRGARSGMNTLLRVGVECPMQSWLYSWRFFTELLSFPFTAQRR